MTSASQRRPGSARLLAALLSVLPGVIVVHAAAHPPRIFHTPGYEAPVDGGPDDLLLLPGAGFDASDRVVYQAVAAGAEDWRGRRLRDCAGR